ncbi:origin recognition complex subunit 4 C-terminus-domain-containing protein [Infundibulicybe gibba]|nr:origin recognition complex subunit 4 C-terminus-domain-containing protein [Infundibulicybe gibba]
MKSFNISDSALPSRFHNCFNKQKRAILRMLQKPPNLVYEDEDDQPPTNDVAIEQLAHLLEGTVLRGEGNSCLVLGPRGSGKTHLVEDCISGLPGNPIILRLSGWIQHTDRLAMQEIAYQLTQQTGTAFLAPSDDNDPEGPRSNQPTEDDVNPFLDVPQDGATPTGLPHATHLPALITLLPTLGRPTIIILDGFDLFALHPRQSLLYCLLDTVQTCRGGVSSKGIAILGVTTRLDTINILEKRVKSRFSGRIFRTAAPNNVDSWITFSQHAFCSIPEGAKDTHTAEWAPLWHCAVDDFLSDATVLDLLRESFGVSRDLKSLCRILIPLVIGLSPLSPFPTHPQLAKAVSSQHSRPRFPYLHALPYPAICLLIAYAHADTAGHQIFTFEMLHEYFRDQLRASLSAPVQINGGSIGMAFESLISINIFIYTTAPSASIPKEFIKCRCAIRHDDVKKAVEKTGQINLKKWLHKAQ